MAETLEELQAKMLRGEKPSIESLYGQLEQLSSKPVDYSQFEQMAQQRQAGGRNDMVGGMALQAFGGSPWKPTGASIFKKALESQDPMELGANDAGYVDPGSGKFIVNPLAARTRQEKLLTGRIDARTREELRKESMRNSAASRAASRQNAEYYKAARLQLAKEAGERAAAKAKAASGPQVVKGWVTTSGGPVYMNSDTQQYEDSQGNATMPLQAAQYGKGIKEQEAGNAARAELDTMISGVKDNPGAYGYSAAITSNLPGGAWLQTSKIPGVGLTESERKVRAGVAKNAYNVIKKLAGAALSMGETMRLDPFVPKPDDPYEIVIDKLDAAKAEYDRIRQSSMRSGTYLSIPTDVKSGVDAGEGWNDLGGGVRIREKR